MTLTKFMARSTWVAHAFEWEKLLKCHLKGKASKKLANGQNIDYSEKRKRPGPRASSAPALGLNTIIFKHVYWYMQQTQVSIYRTIGPLVFYFVLWPIKSVLWLNFKINIIITQLTVDIFQSLFLFFFFYIFLIFAQNID